MNQNNQENLDNYDLVVKKYIREMMLILKIICGQDVV